MFFFKYVFIHPVNMPLLSVRLVVIFPAVQHHCHLASTKFYCLVTKVNVQNYWLSSYTKVEWSGVEHPVFWSGIRHPNYFTIMPLSDNKVNQFPQLLAHMWIVLQMTSDVTMIMKSRYFITNYLFTVYRKHSLWHYTNMYGLVQTDFSFEFPLFKSKCFSMSGTPCLSAWTMDTPICNIRLFLENWMPFLIPPQIHIDLNKKHTQVSQVRGHFLNHWHKAASSL